MFMFDLSALMTPQKATLDSMQPLSWFVSYRRLSPQFQFSLTAVTLGIYLGGVALRNKYTSSEHLSFTVLILLPDKHLPPSTSTGQLLGKADI
jgi:hypothetical protein